MKIIFTNDYEVQDSLKTLYLSGKVIDLPETSCNHFVLRGVAQYVVEPKEEILDIKEDKKAKKK